MTTDREQQREEENNRTNIPFIFFFLNTFWNKYSNVMKGKCCMNLIQRKYFLNAEANNIALGIKEIEINVYVSINVKASLDAPVQAELTETSSYHGFLSRPVVP
jgi:hypothetical protein